MLLTTTQIVPALHFYNSRRRLKTISSANTEKPREHNVTWGQFVITRLIYFSSQPVHKIWRFYLQPFQRNLRGCKILKWIMWPGPRPFQGWSVIRRLTLDIVCKHTKFYRYIRGCEILECVTWPWPRPRRDSWSKIVFKSWWRYSNTSNCSNVAKNCLS